MSDNDAWERGEALEMAQDAADDLRAKLEEQSARIAGLEAECSNLERERSDALFVARETQADNERKADRIAELEAELATSKQVLAEAYATNETLKAERDSVRKALEKLADSFELGSGSPYITGADERMLKATSERIRALLAAARKGGAK